LRKLAYLGLVAGLVLTAAGLWGWLRRVPPSYAALRQAKEETIPGTWGVILEPPPADLEPSLGPAKAFDIAAAGDTPEKVTRSLALVRDEGNGIEGRPAWVFIARDLCFLSNKGELVASSRRPVEPERCTDKNLAIEAIDAKTGEPFMVTSGYDETERWATATGV